MRGVAFRCDQCSEVAANMGQDPFAQFPDVGTAVPPAGWVRFSGDGGRDFCSWACVGDFAELRRDQSKAA